MIRKVFLAGREGRSVYELIIFSYTNTWVTCSPYLFFFPPEYYNNRLGSIN